MDFVEFIKKASRDAHDANQQGALQRLGRALNRGTGLAPLLEKNDPSLEAFSATTLGAIADTHREYMEWMAAAKDLRRYLAKTNLSLPDGSRDTAGSIGEIEALKRIATLCQRSGHLDHDTWAAAVEAHVDLWRAAVTLSLAHGSVAVSLKDPNHPDAPQFDHLTTSRTILQEMPGYTWLAIRRGTRSGALTATLEMPLQEIARQTHARLPFLGLVAQKRGSAELMKDLIEQDLNHTIEQLLDRTAEKDALHSARVAYLGLLNTPALQAERIIACYAEKSSESVGVAIVDKKGDVLQHDELSLDTDIAPLIAAWIEDHGVTAAVLPARTKDTEVKAQLEDAVAPIPIHRIHTAALAEARNNLPFKEIVATALVLGRRALKPGREWGRVNPISLGLGEYPKELDREKLEQTLAEAKLLSSWERRRKNQTARRSRGAARGTTRSVRQLPVGKRMNPSIKTIRDLRPEMTVDGVVTNITRFGAFVNIGLPTEGMIHVSQLAIEFVEDPASVVRVGQQVKARVLEVIPEKERIALSLKPVVEHVQRSPGSQSVFKENSSPEKRTRQAPKSRSAALADLDALFKK